MTDSGKPTLTDRQALGGIIALDGFDYQTWDGLIRLPAWLTSSTFEQLMFEGYDDTEARFFAPHAPRGTLLERYQAKSADLEPAEVKAIFETFRQFELAHPNAVRAFTLVTPRMPSTLRWVVREGARLRSARPFYAPFPDMIAASDASFLSRCEGQWGHELGSFVAHRVEAFERAAGGREQAIHAFCVEFERAFPGMDIRPQQLKGAFYSFCERADKDRGKGIERAELLDILESAVERKLVDRGKTVVHVRSDRNGTDETALEIDASTFSGGGNPFPPGEVWSRALLQPLVATSSWFAARRTTRIVLKGSYRLSTGLALGWAFRSSVGFELEISTKDGSWSTDDRLRPNEEYPSWSLSAAQALDGHRLVVSVGVLHHPVDVLVACGQDRRNVLSASIAVPITSARAAQHLVETLKQAITGTASGLGARAIDLYYAGPAVFAVALGHRWNAMLPTQLFEFVAADQVYVSTARLT